MTSAEDDARWAEATSLLDRAPTESATDRLRRWRRLRVAAALALGTAGAVTGLVLFLLLDVGVAPETDPPLWQVILGLVIQTLALVVIVVGLVVQVKGNRRLRVWRSAMAPLTRGQQKELVAIVRGRAPVVPGRLPLVRYMAELLVHQRSALTGQVGLLVLFAGQWIVSPAAWRLAMVALLAVMFSVAAVFLRRDLARARQFLARHPAADSAA